MDKEIKNKELKEDEEMWKRGKNISCQLLQNTMIQITDKGFIYLEKKTGPHSLQTQADQFREAADITYVSNSAGAPRYPG